MQGTASKRHQSRVLGYCPTLTAAAPADRWRPSLSTIKVVAGPCLHAAAAASAGAKQSPHTAPGAPAQRLPSSAGWAVAAVGPRAKALQGDSDTFFLACGSHGGGVVGTASCPCRCPSPRVVLWKGSSPVGSQGMALTWLQPWCDTVGAWSLGWRSSAPRPKLLCMTRGPPGDSKVTLAQSHSTC